MHQTESIPPPAFATTLPAVQADIHARLKSLEKALDCAGWSILDVDLDLIGAGSRFSMSVERVDGLRLFARIDALGRAMVERSFVERRLRMDANQKGRRPLSPTLEETFLGRSSFSGSREMLAWLGDYIVENATHPTSVENLRPSFALLILPSHHPVIK